MFGLEFLTINPEMAFAVGVLVGMLIAWAVEEDLKSGRGTGHGA